MVVIPEHIEQYLKDLKFTMTEITVLKKLLDGEALTLREIATKTGKSTGVLDQAVKKLILKKIIGRCIENGTPKYRIESLEALVDWVRGDLERKWALWHRKGKDFESYLRTVGESAKRDGIRFFTGKEGIDLLRFELNSMPEDQYVFFPHESTVSQFDKERAKRFSSLRGKNGTIMKVLAVDSAQGKRFKHDDPLYCRETVLCPSECADEGIETVAVGDCVACIDEAAEQAVLIRSAMLAKSKRSLFALLRHLSKSRIDAPMTRSKTHSVTAETSAPDIDAFSRWYAAITPDLPHWLYGIMVSLRILPRTQSPVSANIFTLRIHALDRKKMVSDIAGSFAERDVNLIRFRIYAVPSKSSVYDVRFESDNGGEVAILTDHLKRIPDVLAVKRK